MERKRDAKEALISGGFIYQSRHPRDLLSLVPSRMSRRRGQPKAEEIPSPDSLSSEQALCLVGQSRGSNLFEVTDVTGRVLLAELPSKFRKNVWVRRGALIVALLHQNS